MVGVLDAVRQGYGVSADYIGTGATSFETLLVKFLFAQYAYIQAAIYGGTRYNADGSDNDTMAPGFWLGASGVLKAKSAMLEEAVITGIINNIRVDQLQPTFTHRVLFNESGVWTVPEGIKIVRVTVRGGGGGGGGGANQDTAGGNGGNGGTSSFGSYLYVAGGYGGQGCPVSMVRPNGGAGGSYGTCDGVAYAYCGGRNGGNGTAPSGSPTYMYGGNGGVALDIIGVYESKVEYTNPQQDLPNIAILPLATSPANANGYNGYPGNGGAGGFGTVYYPSGDAGGGAGGGAGAIRQMIISLNESPGQTIAVTVGVGGAGGTGAGGTAPYIGYAGGAGGHGQVLIEY